MSTSSQRLSGVSILSICAFIAAALVAVWAVIVGTQIESEIDATAVHTYYFIAGGLALVGVVALIVSMRSRRSRP